jgi:hypothetical protein
MVPCKHAVFYFLTERASFLFMAMAVVFGHTASRTVRLRMFTGVCGSAALRTDMAPVLRLRCKQHRTNHNNEYNDGNG